MEDQGAMRVPAMQRHLSLMDLIFLGLGSIIGAGIYVVIGFTAKNIAGPGIVVSYGLAGIAALSSGLSFAQLGKHVHTSGGAFEYSTSVFGDCIGWLVGWSTVLEITLSSSAVSRGMGGYLLGDSLAASSQGLDPVALLLIAFLSVILCIGIRESSKFNMAVCSLNMGCILLVILSGASSAQVTNLTENTGGFLPFGMSGVFSAAGIVFFSFIGFDNIPNAAEEAINPTRDVPRSIVASLVISSVLYMGMAFSMVLMQPYTDIDIRAPYKAAFIAQGKHLAAFVVSTGAVCGITTSTMTALLSNARLLAVLGRKGYLPAILASIHQSTKTPIVATVFTGIVAGTLALLVDISTLTELVSAATLAIFFVVNCAALLMILKEGDREDREDREDIMASKPCPPAMESTPIVTAPLEDTAQRDKLPDTQPGTRPLYSRPVIALCASPLAASLLSRLTASAAASTACVMLVIWLPACLKVSRTYHVHIWSPAFGILSTGFLLCSLHLSSLLQYIVYLLVGYGAYRASAKRREDVAMEAYVADLGD